MANSKDLQRLHDKIRRCQNSITENKNLLKDKDTPRGIVDKKLQSLRNLEHNLFQELQNFGKGEIITHIKGFYNKELAPNIVKQSVFELYYPYDARPLINELLTKDCPTCISYNITIIKCREIL